MNTRIGVWQMFDNILKKLEFREWSWLQVKVAWLSCDSRPFRNIRSESSYESSVIRQKYPTEPLFRIQHFWLNHSALVSRIWFTSKITKIALWKNMAPWLSSVIKSLPPRLVFLILSDVRIFYPNNERGSKPTVKDDRNNKEF